MLFNAELRERQEARNRSYFQSLFEVAVAAGVPGAAYLDLGESRALFVGDGSPLTQASGLLSPEHLERIREFYRPLATSWEAIVSSGADGAALGALIRLGGNVVGWEDLLFISLREPRVAREINERIEILSIGEEQTGLWEATMTEGFTEVAPTEESLLVAQLLGCVPGTRRYLALWEGEVAGGASLSLGEGIAFFGGMATLPAFRRHGIQAALIERRLQDASDHDYALLGANPAGGSHRNARRAGFQVAYAQLNLCVPVVV